MNPVPRNYGNTYAQITIPHRSWPPYHSRGESVTQTQFVLVTGLENMSEPRDNGHPCGFQPQIETFQILQIVVREEALEGWHQLNNECFGQAQCSFDARVAASTHELRPDVTQTCRGALPLVRWAVPAAGRISGRNREGGAFCADDSGLGLHLSIPRDRTRYVSSPRAYL